MLREELARELCVLRAMDLGRPALALQSLHRGLLPRRFPRPRADWAPAALLCLPPPPPQSRASPDGRAAKGLLRFLAQLRVERLAPRPSWFAALLPSSSVSQLRVERGSLGAAMLTSKRSVDHRRPIGGVV